MITHLNYTFSVPNNRLYMLYKGITVTPRVVQVSNVSLHDQTAFTRCAPCLCFVRRPFTRLLWPRVMAPSRRSQGPPLASRLLAPSHLRRRRSPLHTFGTEGHRHSGSTRGAVPAKQRSQNSSSISVIVKSPKHAPSKQPEIALRLKPNTWPDVA
jgi:hypothetical protein